MKHSKLGAKNMNKLCPKIVRKALKWPLQYANFQKFLGVACPRTPLKSFLLLKLLEITLPGKNCGWKSDEIWCPLPEKILNTPLTWNILKGLIYARFRVYTSLYLVNIQPNLKSHPPPHQYFLDPLLPRASYSQVKGAKISLRNVFTSHR